MVGLIVISDVNDEPAFGPFDGMKLMVVLVVIARAGWDSGKPLPGFAIIAGLANADFLSLVPEFLAGIKKPAIGKLRRPVRAIDDGGIALGPGDAAIGGTDHPFSKFLVTLLFRDPLMGRQPPRATTVVGKMAGVGERGKCRHEKCPFGRLHHSGVPVIDRTIEERPWKGPRLAIVIRPLHFDPSKRTHMLLPSPGAHDKNLSV